MKKLFLILVLFVCVNYCLADEVAQNAYRLRMAGDVDGAAKLLKKPQSAVQYFELTRLELTKMAIADESFTVKQRQQHMKKSIKKAKKAIKSAVKIEPENSKYHYWLGIAETFDGIYDMHSIWTIFSGAFALKSSLDHFEKTIELDPNNHNAKVLLSGYYERLPWYLGGSKKKAKKYAPTPDANGNTDMIVENKYLITLRQAEKYQNKKQHKKAYEIFCDFAANDSAPNIFKAYAMRRIAEIEPKIKSKSSDTDWLSEANKLDPCSICADGMSMSGQDLLIGLFDEF